MDNSASQLLKKRLDAVLMSITEMIKQDVYQNVIVATVQDWFEGNDSILALNKNINKNVKERWPFLENKIKSHLLEFEEQTKASLKESSGPKMQGLDIKAVSEAVSQSISVALGALGSAFLAMISGGAGTALIASGPVGWIIGAIVGAFAFFLGKTAIEGAISEFIADKRIPAMVKKTAKGKVAAQLKLNESKFESETYDLLREQLQPIYEAIERGLQE